MNRPIIEALQALCGGNVPEMPDVPQDTKTDATKAAEAAIKAAFPEAGSVDGDLLLLDLEGAYEELGFLNGFRLGVRLMAECMK